MTFNTLDKELATLDEKFKQQQVLSEKKGTPNDEINLCCFNAVHHLISKIRSWSP